MNIIFVGRVSFGGSAGWVTPGRFYLVALFSRIIMVIADVGKNTRIL
jgi:hypothetical protein